MWAGQPGGVWASPSVFRPSSLSRRLFAAFWFQVGSPSLWLFSGVHLLQMEGKEQPQWEPPPSPAATPFKTVEEKASDQKICSPKASLSLSVGAAEGGHGKQLPP